MDELYKNLVKLKPKDNVPFKCIGCGECCKHVKEQVPVETLDAFRIARYLMEQDKSITCMDDFWERFAEPALLDECGYFVYFLKTKGPDDACIFLENNRCRIHAVNPRACRTYPFIAGPLENGGYEYLISYERKQHFNGPKVHTKTWMKKRFTPEDQAFLSVDFRTAREIAQLLRRVPEENKVRALLCFQRLKYGDFELDKPFQPQYEENIQCLLEFLREITNETKSV